MAEYIYYFATVRNNWRCMSGDPNYPQSAKYNFQEGGILISIAEDETDALQEALEADTGIGGWERVLLSDGRFAPEAMSLPVVRKTIDTITCHNCGEEIDVLLNKKPIITSATKQLLERFEQWAVTDGECQYCHAPEIMDGQPAKPILYHDAACPITHLEAAAHSLEFIP